MIEATVSGGAQLRRLARALRYAEKVELKREMRAAQRRAFGGLQRLVAEGASILPSGYAPTMARDVRVSIRTYWSGTVAVRAVVYAKGRKEHRDVRRIDKGILRHPVFGNRKVWVSQPVQRHFASGALTRLPDDVLTASAEAVEVVLERLGRI